MSCVCPVCVTVINGRKRRRALKWPLTTGCWAANTIPTRRCQPRACPRSSHTHVYGVHRRRPPPFRRWSGQQIRWRNKQAAACFRKRHKCSGNLSDLEYKRGGLKKPRQAAASAPARRWRNDKMLHESVDLGPLVIFQSNLLAPIPSPISKKAVSQRKSERRYQ